MSRLLGVDVGGSRLKAVVVDGDTVTGVADEEIPARDAIAYAAERAASLAVRHDADGIGMGLAGLVDRTGRFVWGPHLPDGPVDVVEHVAALTDLPVCVDNDATCALVAEVRLGVLRERSDAAVVTIGSGIGGGFLADGRVVRGRNGFAGEFGHLPFAGDGEVCACGRRGCWETVVSGARLDREARRLLSGTARGPDLVAAAEGGHTGAASVLEEVGEALGRGIAALVLVLDVEAVAVAGGAAGAGELLLAPARRAIASEMPGAAHRPVPDLLAARFGRLSGSVGAALIAGGGAT